MNLIEELRNDAAGLKTLKDWVGEGLVPVSKEQAESRATACTKGYDGKPCQFNKAPLWWESAKGSIAEAIKKQIELRNKMELSTSQDADLHMCSACGCCLVLKIFTPIKYIKSHTPEGRVELYPRFCWQRIEMENL